MINDHMIGDYRLAM